jgi:2-polyprenyl-6-methoxyphenol hydroxylase-like FAD-dependent oxidoreductase
MSADRTRRILIVGGGVAGLTARLALRALGFNNVALFDAAADHGVVSANRGLGIWPAAQSALIDLGLADFLRREAALLPAACYRSAQSGTVLSASTTVHRVASLPERRLLSALAGGAHRPESDANANVVHRGRRVEEVTVGDDGAGGVAIRLCDGTWEQGDFLIGADGANSAIRSMVFPNAELVDLCAQCHGGVLPGFDLACHPFETLVGGARDRGLRRFAAVPLQTGCFWFATCGPDITGLDDLAKAVRRHEQVGKGLHAPIADLVAAAQDQNQPICTERVVKLATPLSSWHAPHGRVALIGDAAHPLPPNLAQGASVAIEDAAALAQALGRVFGVPGGGEEVAAPTDESALLAELIRCLGEYEGSRRLRVGRCDLVTGFTRALVASPSVCELMRVVPRGLNQYVFDQFLAHSLGGRDSQTTLHTSPLAV